MTGIVIHSRSVPASLRLPYIVSAGVLAGILALPLRAQVINPESDISRLRVPVPLPRLPDFDLRIQTPERAATPRAVDDIEFEIKNVRFDGGTLYSVEDMRKPFEDILGKKVGLEELRKRVAALETRYRQQGYFLTRVLIPPQQVRDGVFTIQVIEGFISQGFVDGGDARERALIEKMIAGLKDRRPIDLESLEESLLILNDIPGLRASGTLRPGGSLGASELVVSLAPANPMAFLVSVNNAQSKTLGPAQMSVFTSIPRPFGVLGQLGIGLNSALDPFDKFRSLTASYSMPLGATGAIFSLGGLTAQARPRGSLANDRIHTESWSISPRVRMPIKRTMRESLFLDAGLALSRSETVSGYNTASQTVLTSDRTTVGELSLSYLQSGWMRGVTQGTLSTYRGLGALGAFEKNTPKPSIIGFNPTFSKTVLTVTRLQGLPQQFSLQALAQIQRTKDKLLTGDQAVFGGSFIGRGYVGGAIAGDRGYGALLELRWDRTDPLSLPWISSFAPFKDMKLQVFGSYDYASVTRLPSAAAGTRQTEASIASSAVGVRLRNNSGLTLEAMVANANTTVRSSDPRPDPILLLRIDQAF